MCKAKIPGSETCYRFMPLEKEWRAYLAALRML